MKRLFTPTSNNYSEIRKAEIKNHNLPILQMLYNGNKNKPLYCLLSGEPGWRDVKDFVTKKPKQRFNLDFNHIRQEKDPKRHAGISKDKGSYSPSGIFRGFRLDENIHYLIEFMTIMPVSHEYHSYISQDSSINDICLTSFNSKKWPWFLKKEENFNKIKDLYKLKFEYKWFLDHLSNISNDSIYVRGIWI